jgi:hypothetical protein
MTPFDIVKIINEKLPHDREEVLASYDAWVINKAMSNTIDTSFFAAEMNKYPDLPVNVQFDFYYYGVPKGKRYGSWNKADTTDKEVINNICNLYSVNVNVAKRYLTLLSEEEKEQILSMEGGKYNGRDKNRGTNRA